MNKTSRIGDALVGLGYGVLVAAFLAVAVLMYNKAFTPSVDVTLTTTHLGSALQKGSDVKLNGVPVGKVTSVRSVDNGAELSLALDPGTAKQLSGETTARLLPKTLFGERYVSLQPANTPPGDGMHDGDTIQQDRSQQAVELEEVFDELLPLLQSIQPEKLSATLGELSTMLRGRGEEIGDTFVAWSEYMKKINPQVPQIADDFERLGRVASNWAEAAPDLLAALDSFTTTSRTMVAERSELSDLYANVITAANTSRGWVSDNQDTIEVLADESRAALEATKPYAREFPCLLKAMNQFIPEMDRNLGKDTDEPGMHVVLNVVDSRGKYIAGQDKVTYSKGGQARCPYVTGQTGTTAAAKAAGVPTIAAPPTSTVQQQLTGARGLGQANSAAENQMIAELMAPTQGIAPEDYPRWSSLLLGPVLRGTKVKLQ